MLPSFDADAAARPDSGIFGLDCRRDQARVVLVPVPFAATVSYRSGTVDGPAAILAASHQVELFHPALGRPYASGIHMLPIPAATRAASLRARALAQPLIEKGGAGAADAEHCREVDAICRAVHAEVQEIVAGLFAEGRLPGVVGGDHSVALGGILAAAQRHAGLGVLQVDAHADLRRAFEGLEYSHASVMDLVLRHAPGVARLVQVGLRDVCETEVLRGAEDPRVFMHFDSVWKGRLAGGATFDSLCAEAIAALPDEVWVSFDIDGFDPSLCPHTGTPVPGGLRFHEGCILLQRLVESGRRIVGFDLSEVAPGEGDEWDGNVGARLLYELCGRALMLHQG